MEDITVIIAHYAPEEYYRIILKKTIQSIRRQNFNGKITIIVADDGSQWSQQLLKSNEKIKIFSKEEIQSNVVLQDLDIDIYILGMRTNEYQKAILWNIATKITDCDDLVYLDDDHPFLRKNSLKKYKNLLKRNQFVIGRIINPDGKYRLYDDKTVQGTNFGMKHSLIDSVGGFGEYTSEWGAGEDSDVFWKVYLKLKTLSDTPLAVYAVEIITKDCASGRWKKCDGSMEIFSKGFFELHGVLEHDNFSRVKGNWVKFDSRMPKLIESRYIISNMSHDFKRRIIHILKKIIRIGYNKKT